MRSRWLIRITLLAYLSYVALLTVLVYNPTTAVPSRAIVGMALILFILGMVVSGGSPSYAAYQG